MAVLVCVWGDMNGGSYDGTLTAREVLEHHDRGSWFGCAHRV
jgi:hypothetical protein